MAEPYHPEHDLRQLVESPVSPEGAEIAATALIHEQSAFQEEKRQLQAESAEARFAPSDEERQRYAKLREAQANFPEPDQYFASEEYKDWKAFLDEHYQPDIQDKLDQYRAAERQPEAGPLRAFFAAGMERVMAIEVARLLEVPSADRGRERAFGILAASLELVFTPAQHPTVQPVQDRLRLAAGILQHAHIDNKTLASLVVKLAEREGWGPGAIRYGQKETPDEFLRREGRRTAERTHQELADYLPILEQTQALLKVSPRYASATEQASPYWSASLDAHGFGIDSEGGVIDKQAADREPARALYRQTRADMERLSAAEEAKLEERTRQQALERQRRNEEFDQLVALVPTIDDSVQALKKAAQQSETTLKEREALLGALPRDEQALQSALAEWRQAARPQRTLLGKEKPLTEAQRQAADLLKAYEDRHQGLQEAVAAKAQTDYQNQLAKQRETGKRIVELARVLQRFDEIPQAVSQRETVPLRYDH